MSLDRPLCLRAILSYLPRFFGPVSGEYYIQHKGKPLRAFFVFDPLRQAIVLCMGDKSGKKRFYIEMIAIADEEYAHHLSTLGEH